MGCSSSTPVEQPEPPPQQRTIAEPQLREPLPPQPPPEWPPELQPVQPPTYVEPPSPELIAPGSPELIVPSPEPNAVPEPAAPEPAMLELQQLAAEMQQMQEASAVAEQSLASGEAPPAGLRNQLAQLHGSLNNRYTARLDAIVTGDLTAGREEARAMRKQLLAQTEALIVMVEGQIRRIDAR